MATAIIAGIAMYGAAAGAGVAVTTAVALGAAAAAATMLMEQAMTPDAPSQAAVSIGDKGTPIDKTRMQEEAEVGKLKLGEDDKKKKRKRGKAAFKIELDKQADAAGEGGDTGVQVAKPKDLGVQL